MMPYEKTWLLRVDPKDPNGMIGMNLHYHCIDENQKNNFVKEGVPLWCLMSNLKESAKMIRIRVKWVYSLRVENAVKLFSSSEEGVER